MLVIIAWKFQFNYAKFIVYNIDIRIIIFGFEGWYQYFIFFLFYIDYYKA
jgi:hypothetical protein